MIHEDSHLCKDCLPLGGFLTEEEGLEQSCGPPRPGASHEGLSIQWDTALLMKLLSAPEPIRCLRAES